MKSCPFCFGHIPAEARKCKHCGEWVERGAEDESNVELAGESGPRKAAASRYNFGEKAFLLSLLSFCIPPLGLIAVSLGTAALFRQSRGDSLGLAIAGVVVGVIALFAWAVYFIVLIIAVSQS